METLEKVAQKSVVEVPNSSDDSSSSEVSEYEGLVLKQQVNYANGGTGKLYWM